MGMSLTQSNVLVAKSKADPEHLSVTADPGIRVIFVEDDDYYRDAVEIELGDEGFAVHSFRDGPSMLAAIADGLRADLIVLDWGLDSMLGIELLAQIRAQGLKWPIVFLTGRSTPTHERLALQRGAADFVDKARGTAILAARLRMIAKQQQSVPDFSPEDIFHCGRLTLRPRVSRAYLDGVDVCLTVAEFKVVRLLASNVGSFITYRRIYDCTHNAGFVTGSGEDGYRINVRSSIKRIRNKFKAICPDFDEIQTYTSFGYCWGKVRDVG